MRPNDKEKVADYKIKEKHLEDIIRQFGLPLVWYDDNPGVIKMLREQKIPVIAVVST
jgi:hypothetical protein